ncbi:MAG: hypothetical protein NW241_07060 [Bacteroidia bacterium]|nr:hypothetical protein [Bacteroidia bacterium]
MNHRLRRAVLLPALLLLSAALALTLTHCRSRIALVPPAGYEPYFSGTLLALSDADQIGGAYADGVANKVAGTEDSLAIIRFTAPGQTSVRSVAVSNSVVSWPAVLTASPDGRWAYAAETRGPFPNSTGRVENIWESLPAGRQMSVVDVAAAAVVQQVDLGPNLTSATLNAEGTLLATASSENGRDELIVAVLRDGLISRIFRQPVSGARHDLGTDSGIKTVEFSPAGDILAVNLHTEDLAFFKVAGDSAGLQILPVGSPLRQVATCWSVGNWTPDGRFFILSDVAWGDGPAGAVTNRPGSLISVAFDPAGQHQIVSRAPVGLSPEGFDLSPDGRWAVTVNMRRTYLPRGFPYALIPAQRYASLSLVQIDPATGSLQTQGEEYGFEGELPEDAVFDAEGRGVAVAIYHDRYERYPRQGYVAYWRLNGNRLERSSLRIPVTRGVHTLFRSR